MQLEAQIEEKFVNCVRVRDNDSHQLPLQITNNLNKKKKIIGLYDHICVLYKISQLCSNY
jgi:hypothetical protein